MDLKEVLDTNLNELQKDDLRQMNERMKSMHYANVRVRHGGGEHWFEADWLKYVVPELIKIMDGEDS